MAEVATYVLMGSVLLLAMLLLHVINLKHETIRPLDLVEDDVRKRGARDAALRALVRARLGPPPTQGPKVDYTISVLSGSIEALAKVREWPELRDEERALIVAAAQVLEEASAISASMLNSNARTQVSTWQQLEDRLNKLRFESMTKLRSSW